VSKSRDELRRQAEALKDTPAEVEGLEPVLATIKENAEVVFSLRFTPSEMIALRDAAEARGVRVSELVRRAALAAAGDAERRPTERDVALREARQFVQAAAQALERA